MDFLKIYSLKREEQLIESIANQAMLDKQTNDSYIIKDEIQEKIKNALDKKLFELLDNILKQYTISPQIIKKSDKNYDYIQLLIEYNLLKFDENYYNETGDYYVFFEENLVNEKFSKIIKWEFKMYIYEDDLKRNLEYYNKLKELFEIKKEKNWLLEINCKDTYASISRNNNKILITKWNLSFFLPKNEFPLWFIWKNNQFWKNNQW